MLHDTYQYLFCWVSRLSFLLCKVWSQRKGYYIQCKARQGPNLIYTTLYHSTTWARDNTLQDKFIWQHTHTEHRTSTRHLILQLLEESKSRWPIMDFSCIATTVVLHNMYNKNVSRKIGQHLNKSEILKWRSYFLRSNKYCFYRFFL